MVLDFTNEAEQIRKISRRLLDEWNGEVPADLDELLQAEGEKGDMVKVSDTWEGIADWIGAASGSSSWPR